MDLDVNLNLLTTPQYDGPEIIAPAIEEVSGPAVLGICLASSLFLLVVGVICFVYRRRDVSLNTKLIGDRSAHPVFHQPRKPTAVKSPAGPTSGPHYLRKSPSPGTTPGGGSTANSPTGSTVSGKPLKSAGNSPNTEEPNSTSGFEGNNLTKFHVENETNKKSSESLKEELEKAEKVLNKSSNSPLGQFEFKLRYKKEKNKLVVSVVRCKDLPAKDTSIGSSYPYIKLQLLPEKRHKVKTRVLRKTCNPVFEEDFTFFGINKDQLQSTTLYFVILSFDSYSRDDVIGEVLYPLDSVELSKTDNQEIVLCKDIQPRSPKVQAQGRGELLVSLCWQPAANRLTVVILKARNLPKMDVSGLADPYVKMYLICNGQRIAKKKTHVKKETLNPVFNESFIFEVPSTADGLKNVRLECMLLDWDRLTKDEVIGKLIFGGSDSTETANSHWDEICTSPRRQIAEWHKLIE